MKLSPAQLSNSFLSRLKAFFWVYEIGTKLLIALETHPEQLTLYLLLMVFLSSMYWELEWVAQGAGDLQIQARWLRALSNLI